MSNFEIFKNVEFKKDRFISGSSKQLRNSTFLVHLFDIPLLRRSKFFIMPSFDIVSKVDAQALDNAVNVVTKEISNRFDFKGSHVAINLDKKEFKLNIETEDDRKE